MKGPMDKPTAETGDRVRRSRAQRLGVDFSKLTGSVHGGATGMLYGMSDVGVPAAALIAGAGPHTIAQMAPKGAQHPNGDALTVSIPFLANGGRAVLVYMQDIYSQWPYEDEGIDNYLAKVKIMVSAVASSPNADKFCWVPFNEPDWIWYADWDVDKDRFMADWTSVYAEIRKVLPHATIVGPNEMSFHPGRLHDFLVEAKESDVLPDVISWHELNPNSLAEYRANYTYYREIEKKVGISPLPININEYGNRRDTSNPGQMIQWISMFEDTKVDADMAYWTYAGNLDDQAVQTGRANGGWWLLKWYADLTGQTVKVTPPALNVADTLQATAAIDRDRQQATVLFGGTAADVRLDLTQIPTDFFGDRVDVTVTKTSWSGYEGDATNPPVLSRTRLSVHRGSVSVLVAGGDCMAAYQVVVTPMEKDVDTSRAPWTVRYEAEDAALTAATVLIQDDDPQKYATSGGRDVGGMNEADSAVTFNITAPVSGPYTLGVFFGTNGVPARQALYLDNMFIRLLTYSATLSWTYRGRLDVPLELTAGQHSVSIRTRGPNGMLSDSDVTLDCIDLSHDAEPGISTRERSTYPARVARLSVHARLRAGDATTPAVAVLTDGDSAVFFVAAGEDGYYDLGTLFGSYGSSALGVKVNGRLVQDASCAEQGRWKASARVHLAQGISAVQLLAQGAPVDVAGLWLVRVVAADAATDSIEAEDTKLSGGATVFRDSYASAGAYVGHIGKGLGQLTFERGTARGAGAFNLTVSYANAAKNSASHYNTDVISLSATISEAGGVGMTAWFRHNYAWDNFWSLVLPLDLTTAEGDLTIGNSADWAPNIDRVRLSPRVISTSVHRTRLGGQGWSM